MAEIIPLGDAARKPSDALADDALAKLQAAFADELAAVEQHIATHMDSVTEIIPQITSHIVGAGGKRLRPLLTLSAARLLDYRGAHHITLAAAVEFMHTATLLHDDVVDDSDMRRGQPTVRQLWGNPASVLVGDFLLGQAFRMMVSAKNLSALDILSKAAAIIAEGEMMQLTALNNTQMTEDSYMKIIEAKTAALFAAATEIGGVIAQADTANIKALYAYGRNLGIAFQLVDDVLDYGGIGHKLGKNTGEDFTEGKVTLPVILAVHRGNKTQRDFWRAAMSQPQNGENNEAQFEQALHLLKQNNALKDTIIRAVHYGDRAKDAIGLFENSQTRTQLIELADFCTNRAY